MDNLKGKELADALRKVLLLLDRAIERAEGGAA